MTLYLALPYLTCYLAASLAVVKRHAPRWLAPLIAVALAIPGPQDEAVVFLIVLVLIAVKPELRAELRAIWSVRPFPLRPLRGPGGEPIRQRLRRMPLPTTHNERI